MTFFFFFWPILAGELVCPAPPTIEDADFIKSKTEYRNGESVQYFCPRFYVMEGGPYQTCKNGKWTGHLRCISKFQFNLFISLHYENIALIKYLKYISWQFEKFSYFKHKKKINCIVGNILLFKNVLVDFSNIKYFRND